VPPYRVVGASHLCSLLNEVVKMLMRGLRCSLAPVLYPSYSCSRPKPSRVPKASCNTGFVMVFAALVRALFLR
jgi:hypothetical protein